jgi:hypothetical protein
VEGVHRPTLPQGHPQVPSWTCHRTRTYSGKHDIGGENEQPLILFCLQLEVATPECIAVLHRLEQVSSQEHVGSLSENLLEALRTNPAVAAKVEQVSCYSSVGMILHLESYCLDQVSSYPLPFIQYSGGK